MDLQAAEKELRRLSGNIDKGIEQMRLQSTALADAEHAYRLGKAQAWGSCPHDHEDRRMTVPEREAWVQAETAGLRHTRDLADGQLRAAQEAVRARRAQLSAMQSLLAAHREEASFARTGPEWTA